MISLSLIVLYAGTIFRRLDYANKVFSVTFFTIYLIQVTMFVLSKLSIGNLLLFHVYFAVQLIGYGLFYWKILPVISAKKWFLVTLFICIVLIVYEYSVKWENLSHVFGGYSYFIMNLIFVFTSIYYLVIEFLRDMEVEHKYLNYGMILYAGGSSIIFLLGDKLSYLDWKPLLLVNILLFIIFQGFYLMQLWKVRNS